MNPSVRIHYHRPPDTLNVYEQVLLLDDPAVQVTFQPETPIDAPLLVGGSPVLEPGSPAVWFTFPGRWHDIGRFHTLDGRFTGLYANLLTPPVLHPAPAEHAVPRRWDTTDLFLDLWLDPSGTLEVLDRDQFEEACARGWLSDDEVSGALAELVRLERAHAAGRWPPPVVHEWPLERALRHTLQDEIR